MIRLRCCICQESPQSCSCRNTSGRYKHQQAQSGGACKLHLSPHVLYLCLTLTNGRCECRPGVNAHLRMTQFAVEDLQQSSKKLQRRIQCSRDKDQNNKCLTIAADQHYAWKAMVLLEYTNMFPALLLHKQMQFK